MITTSLLGLFAAAFVAASVIPGSSEAVMLYLLATGFEPLTLWIVATLGNVAGSALNWWLGLFALRYRDRRWFPVGEAGLERAQGYFRRWGTAALLMSWVPGIGDAFTVVAGALRTPLAMFLLLVTIAKGARYAVLLGVAEGFGLGEQAFQVPLDLWG